MGQVQDYDEKTGVDYYCRRVGVLRGVVYLPADDERETDTQRPSEIVR